MRLEVAVVLAVLTATVNCAQESTTWKEKFNYFNCYSVDPSERMPNTLDNLIGILHKFENQSSSYINLDEMAEMIINRYRTDGIVYNSLTRHYGVGDIDKETEKEELVRKVANPSLVLPVDSFDSREECGLHMLVSHSTDNYPFAGIDAIWDGTINRHNRGDRSKRSSGFSSSSASSSSSSTGGSSFSGSSSGNSERIYSGSGSMPNSRDILNYEPAVHPVENGVMETEFGPVAAGTLLTGLMSINDQSSYSLSSLLDDTSYMPQSMKAKNIKPVYAASLSGDMGQMALAALSVETINTHMGPAGRYHNCTTCARQYSLETAGYTLLSRAELNAGLDVMIINEAYTTGSGSYTNSLSLSQVLKLYYSNKGLPNFPDFKACNRMKLYNSLDTAMIFDQALNFMYAYQDYFKTLKDKVEIYKNDFVRIEAEFKKYLTATKQVMDSFINSYNYDDEGYSQCTSSNNLNQGSSWSPSNSNGLRSETVSDLIVIYAEQGTSEQTRDQRQMISDVARRLRMDSLSSAMGVMRGTDGTWILPFSNITNLGDWACNFTSDYSVSGGGASHNDGISIVLKQLSMHYDVIYKNAREHEHTSSGRSQVVIWQVPGAVQGDEMNNNHTIQNFRTLYPDVRIIFIGRNRAPYEYLLDDEDDFLSITGTTMNQVTTSMVGKVHDSPRYFIYPACDPNNENITNIQNHREDTHIYEGFITPNYTTYIRIPSQNFHYSEEVILKVSGTVRTCASRTNRYASEDVQIENINNEHAVKSVDDPLVCIGGANDVEEKIVYRWPCDRYLKTCNPIYLSVTALSTGKGQTRCTGNNNICEFPHQMKYQLSHEGMTCGASTSLPAMLLFLLPALLAHYLH